MLEVKNKPNGFSQTASATAPARVGVDQPAVHPTTGGPADSSPALRSAQSFPDLRDFHAKLPVITGEVQFKGTISVDGVVNGGLGAQGGLALKQRLTASSEPAMVGAFYFKDMVRINGHIAGTVESKGGTIIVDVSAKVDAKVEVAVAVIGGAVTGDIIARERVELGPTSKIYGNIWTRSIVIKDGAIFEGVCRMIEDGQAV